jgi:hypothetical protein
MFWPLSAAVLLLAASMAVLVVVLRQQMGNSAVGKRGVRIQEAWEGWQRLDALDEPRRSARRALLDQLNDTVRESVRQNLLEFENSLQGQRAPLENLRRELMDSVDRRLLNTEILQLPPEVRLRLRRHSPDMLQSDEEARTYIAANELRMAVLREYGALRFGDRADGDWFDVYEKASRLKQRGARNFIQRTLNGTQSSADDARYQSMTMVDHEIRTRLLKVPAGTRFQGFGAQEVAEK